MDSKTEVPVVARRRRKAARQLRESTPDPTQRLGGREGYGSQSQASDDQSGSESRSNCQSSMDSSPHGSVNSGKKSFIERALDYSSHRNKILSRKEKKLTIVSPRSRSVPRDSEEVPSSPEIFSLLRRAKKSLTVSRKPKTDDSSDGGKVSDTEVRQRRERIERYQSERNKDSDTRSSHLQSNLVRFNEERRKFELEKLKFLQEKRELDRMRLRRFEKYREEMLEEQRLKLQTELKNRERDERSQSTEAPVLPPVPPSRSKTPVSPGPIKKKLLIIPKTSSASASSSEDEGHNTSDEEKKATVRRRFSPRKPKRPRSVKLEAIAPKTPEPATSPEPESELPSDYPPEGESAIPDDPDPVMIPEKKAEDEMVLTQRKTVKQEKVEEKDIIDEAVSEKKMESVKDEEREPVVVSEQKKVEGPKEKKRRRDLKVYVDKADDQFTWSELYNEAKEYWLDFIDDNPLEIHRLRLRLNECFFYLGVLVLLCGIGGVIFRVTEGTFESQYKCGVKRVKRDFIDYLWLSSHNQKEEDWKQTARTRLRKFEEELQVAFEAGMKTYSGSTAWNFVNGVIYSLTVVSTIGYGHITPSTTTGRALTIVYAIIGIPIFLIVLADFGKLFTRGIKFLWAYVRRLYYTGSIRKVRKTAQVKEVMKGLNVVYDMVRRPSGEHELQPTGQPVPEQMHPLNPDEIQPAPTCESPTTPVPETFEIDDEFNLPISVAIFILIAYMLFGATIYFTWENWSFFEAFYFVFVSISTIGFGDFVPQHPIYMMCSILYLIFGLALTSMCINVVQLKLSDSFRQASAKIGATIGLQMAEAASLQQSQSQVHTPDALTDIHTSTPTANGGQPVVPPSEAGTAAFNVGPPDTPPNPASISKISKEK